MTIMPHPCRYQRIKLFNIQVVFLLHLFICSAGDWTWVFIHACHEFCLGTNSPSLMEGQKSHLSLIRYLRLYNYNIFPFPFSLQILLYIPFLQIHGLCFSLIFIVCFLEKEPWDGIHTPCEKQCFFCDTRYWKTRCNLLVSWVFPQPHFSSFFTAGMYVCITH